MDGERKLVTELISDAIATLESPSPTGGIYCKRTDQQLLREIEGSPARRLPKKDKEKRQAALMEIGISEDRARHHEKVLESLKAELDWRARQRSDLRWLLSATRGGRWFGLLGIDHEAAIGRLRARGLLMLNHSAGITPPAEPLPLDAAA